MNLDQLLLWAAPKYCCCKPPRCSSLLDFWRQLLGAAYIIFVICFVCGKPDAAA
jgi:hypothetical protein